MPPFEQNVPVNDEATSSNSSEQKQTLKGEISYQHFEGGFYGFIAENGRKFTLKNLPKANRQNGLIVEIKGVIDKDLLSFTQFGDILEIKQIHVIDDTKVTRPVPNKSNK